MAKTACFDAEGVLINIYDSGKEAKAANKGTDVTFVHNKNFPEGGIGEYKTLEDLFPAPEPEPAPAAREPGTRTVIKREGAYVVVKADGARFPEGDERAALHSALMNNTSVEAYLEAAPAEANFTSSRGAAQKVSATGYMAYAFKRGWVAQTTTESDSE